jgi:hypothetical protein
MLNAKNICNYCVRWNFRLTKYESVIAKNADYAYYYSYYVICDRFLLAEKMLAKKRYKTYFKSYNI